MKLPAPDAVPLMRTPALLSALNDCQTAFNASKGATGDEVLRILVTHMRIYRTLRERGMTELAIESFIRNLPNWPGP